MGKRRNKDFSARQSSLRKPDQAVRVVVEDKPFDRLLDQPQRPLLPASVVLYDGENVWVCDHRYGRKGRINGSGGQSKTFKMPVPILRFDQKTFESGQILDIHRKDWLTVVVEHRVASKTRKKQPNLKASIGRLFLLDALLSLDEDYDVYLKSLYRRTYAHALEQVRAFALKQSCGRQRYVLILSKNNNNHVTRIR